MAGSLVEHVTEISAKRKGHWAKKKEPKLDNARRREEFLFLIPKDTAKTTNNAINKGRKRFHATRQFERLPEAMKIPNAKAAVDQEWEQLKNLPTSYLTNLRKVTLTAKRVRKNYSRHCGLEYSRVLTRTNVGSEAVDILPRCFDLVKPSAENASK